MSLIATNLKHFSITFILLLVLLVCSGLYIGADAHLFEDKPAYKLEGETHLFFENGQLISKVLKGDTEDGFWVESNAVEGLSGESQIDVLFPEDDSRFTVTVDRDLKRPESVYETGQPIVAISDIESGFAAFRDFLVTHKVADKDLNWIFGNGHLVLVGDFVDRGASTTQVLWAIYKLEQSAKKAGGNVHFIIGNHEIKSMQGNFQSADEKYFYIAGMLGKQQYQLFDDNSLLGRWMASKNVLEIINGVAFVHGGLHPEIADYELSVDEINDIVRQGYRQLYFTPIKQDQRSFLRSSTTGPAWYRGYFKESLSQEQIEGSLAAVGAKTVVVGHTLQSKVSALYDNKVFAIDVRHPKDYLTSFPLRRSEGLLIKSGEYYRLTESGEAILM